MYQSTIFSVLGDAGEKFGEKMQSLFLHESPQVKQKYSSDCPCGNYSKMGLFSESDNN